MFQITFELIYPESNNDIRECIVIADNFGIAEEKVKANYRKEYEYAKILKIIKIDSDLIK